MRDRSRHERIGRRLAALAYDDEATVRFADSVLAADEALQQRPTPTS